MTSQISETRTFDSMKSVEKGLLMLLATLAGLSGWALGERTREFAKVPLEISSKAYQFAELNAATIRVNSVNGALVHAGLGCFTLLAIFVAGALAGKLEKRQLPRLILVAVLGTAVCALPSFVVMPLHAANADNDPGSLDLTIPLLLHMGLWVPIGIAAGLAFAAVRSRHRSAFLPAILAGAMGAAVGAIVYEFAGAIGFPSDKTVEPMAATSRARLLAHLCVAVGSVAGLIFTSSKRQRADTKPEPIAGE